MPRRQNRILFCSTAAFLAASSTPASRRRRRRNENRDEICFRNRLLIAPVAAMNQIRITRGELGSYKSSGGSTVVVVVCTVDVITRASKAYGCRTRTARKKSASFTSGQKHHTQISHLIGNTHHRRQRRDLFLAFSCTHGSIRGSGVDPRGLSFLPSTPSIHGGRADLRSSNGGHGARTHTY